MPMRKVLEKRRRINSFAEREPTSREGGREDDRTDSETANILEEGARPVNEFHADQRGDFFLSLSLYWLSSPFVVQPRPFCGPESPGYRVLIISGCAGSFSPAGERRVSSVN